MVTTGRKVTADGMGYAVVPYEVGGEASMSPADVMAELSRRLDWSPSGFDGYYVRGDMTVGAEYLGVS